MPPPCCIVRAASRRWAKIPPMSSGIAPITKQLNKVTSRPLPAPATTRPAGRDLKSVIAAQNRWLHNAGSRSGAASAVATRRHVSSIVLSSGSPEGPLRRYFMSQICCEIDATTAMGDGSSLPKQYTTVLHSFVPTFLDTPLALSLPHGPIDRLALRGRLLRLDPTASGAAASSARGRQRNRP